MRKTLLRPSRGANMSFGQFSIRNREILHERESGYSLEDLASKYGLRRTTVKALLIRERHRRTFELMHQLAQAS
jgi:Mor family transcriptional regulator